MPKTRKPTRHPKTNYGPFAHLIYDDETTFSNQKFSIKKNFEIFTGVLAGKIGDVRDNLDDYAMKAFYTVLNAGKSGK